MGRPPDVVHVSKYAPGLTQSAVSSFVPSSGVMMLTRYVNLSVWYRSSYLISTWEGASTLCHCLFFLCTYPLSQLVVRMLQPHGLLLDMLVCETAAQVVSVYTIKCLSEVQKFTYIYLCHSVHCSMMLQSKYLVSTASMPPEPWVLVPQYCINSICHSSNDYLGHNFTWHWQ